MNSWSGIVTQGNEVSNYYAGTVGGTASKAVVTTTGTVGGGSGSYYNLMDDYGNVASQVGTFYNWITSQTGETNAGNPQIQNLFQWVGNTTHTSKSGHNTLEGLDASFAGTLLGTLQVEFDGSNNLYTLFTPEGAPTPIPPGVLLLAPGLFGLIGWRRKMWHS